MYYIIYMYYLNPFITIYYYTYFGGDSMKHAGKLLVMAMIFILIASSVNEISAKQRQGSAPNVPSGLVVTNSSSSEVTLGWSLVSGATGYKVYRATPNDSNYALIATVYTNSYKNTNLAPSTNYWYFVRAYNSYGTSVDSAHIKVTTNALIPISTPKTVLGFTTYYYSGDNSSYNAMVNNYSSIDEIATQSFNADSAGNITGLVPTNQLTFANNSGIKTLAMVANNFDGNIAKSIVENPANRQELINNILAQLKLNGYKGVNIDFEGVFYYDRDYYTTFLTELYNTLHAQGFIVTVAVPAKTSDSITNSWTGAYDYGKIANVSDQVVLMTYDEHYPGGSPGAVASIGWVENVIKYAVTVIPKEKILLGTAAYGYDWSGSLTKAYGITGMYNLAATTGSTIMWDSVAQSAFFNYVDSSNVSHSVWFEEAKSLGYKLDLVNKYNLAGIGIWRLGLENSNYWATIKDKLNK